MKKFKCPCCQLSGDDDLFQPNWPERMSELLASKSGAGAEADIREMSWQERRWFYNGLLNKGDQDDR